MCDRCAILLFICMMKHYVSVLGPINPIGFPAPFAIWMLLSMTIAVLLHVHVCSTCHAIIYYCTLHWYHIAINLIWFDDLNCHPIVKCSDFRTLIQCQAQSITLMYNVTDISLPQHRHISLFIQYPFVILDKSTLINGFERRWIFGIKEKTKQHKTKTDRHIELLH